MALLAAIPSHVAMMRASVWLDEAWVANSIQAPTWREMFWYPRWLQSSPPLFLALERGIAHFLGMSEVALRLLPCLAGIVALVFLVLALRRVANPAAAMMGCALVAGNYWAVKYPQHLK